ncbi:uncharacterized protein LOC110997631 [Pieris rapae]|uniref:uncharacterized protein LOC110997631 n=1 Tax=Pieris rapae TaxID=64459 RepID=UPI001E27D8AF|nr:uncharacterized protein LOC110997631 [Pieris rapae]
MINLTPYNFQPIFHRFMVVYRCMHTVTDCVTFVLSCLCCQCWEPMPLSQSSGGCTFYGDVNVAPEEKLDTGRACGEPLKTQHLVINFTQGHDDSIEVQQKVQKFWNLVDQSSELGKFLEPPFEPDNSTTAATSKASHKSLHSFKSNLSNKTKTSQKYPAVHLFRSLDKKGKSKS